MWTTLNNLKFFFVLYLFVAVWSELVCSCCLFVCIFDVILAWSAFQFSLAFQFFFSFFSGLALDEPIAEPSLSYLVKILWSFNVSFTWHHLLPSNFWLGWLTWITWIKWLLVVVTSNKMLSQFPKIKFSRFSSCFTKINFLYF